MGVDDVHGESCRLADDLPILEAGPAPVNQPQAGSVAASGEFCDDFQQRWMLKTGGRMQMRGLYRIFLVTLVALMVTPAGAAEKLRVGKAVPFAWTFTPVDVGIATGEFAKQGLDVEVSAFAGDAKLQQALTAGSIDIAIGSGPGMAFMAKGVPAKGVAAMAGIPRNMAVMVRYDLPIKTVDDLKGKKLGVTTVGSLTYWIGQRINQVKGWGSDGINVIPVGGMGPARGAIKTGQLDGYIGALEAGYALEEKKEWKVVTTATPFVDHFITHVIFARNSLIKEHPERVQAFLQGWFNTIAFMKKNKAKSVEITAKVIKLTPSVVGRAYDEEIGIFTTDGVFDPKAVAALKKSFVDMGRLKEMPDDKVLFTTQFLPIKPKM
jgi:ABC-type nitrate/sulfonate/bicarbonate transport system substrate-binding protein